MFSDLVDPELALELVHVSLFIIFPSFAYLTCTYRPGGALRVLLLLLLIFHSQNGECRNHRYGNSLKEKGRQDNKQKQEEQFSGHHLFSYVVLRPSLMSTRVLPPLIKNEMDPMLFLGANLHINGKNVSASSAVKRDESQQVLPAQVERNQVRPPVSRATSHSLGRLKTRRGRKVFLGGVDPWRITSRRASSSPSPSPHFGECSESRMNNPCVHQILLSSCWEMNTKLAQ